MSEAGRDGVLLVNLGTPAAPTAGAIRRWLREFLSDPRVVELPRLAWLPILYGFVLPLRPYRLTHAYRSIWTAEGSPLLGGSRALRAALEEALGEPVALAMRYGEPRVAAALDELQARGVHRVRVLPLYPQYSSTTTASAYDGVLAALRSRRVVPALRFIPDYHDDPALTGALAERVRSHWAQAGRRGHLLMSFHGLPKRNVTLGDPYEAQCQRSARLLAEALRLSDTQWSLAYQSRFGAAEWLGPATETRLRDLGKAGTPVDLICPGFAVDCLETLEEIAQRGREVYAGEGGGDCRYIPCLNAAPAHVAALAALCRRGAF